MTTRTSSLPPIPTSPRLARSSPRSMRLRRLTWSGDRVGHSRSRSTSPSSGGPCSRSPLTRRHGTTTASRSPTRRRTSTRRRTNSSPRTAGSNCGRTASTSNRPGPRTPGRWSGGVVRWPASTPRTSSVRLPANRSSATRDDPNRPPSRSTSARANPGPSPTSRPPSMLQPTCCVRSTRHLRPSPRGAASPAWPPTSRPSAR